MSLFDQLVDEALQNKPELTSLRLVVEKELLHHDILRVLSQSGMLSKLTFIGGTCLRSCYGSNRLSEDLDFTGGEDFNKDILSEMAQVLIDSLKNKYGLNIEVSEPKREIGNVDTWKLKVQTRPGRRDLPAQRINIDVCSVPSHKTQPMMLLNLYGVDIGTNGLILQVQSKEEIFADKLVAFALRPNRMKYRDLWDITWLHQQALKLPLDIVKLKLKDHSCETKIFLMLLNKRRELLKNDPKLVIEFRKEMYRFLPPEILEQTLQQDIFWEFLVNLIDELCIKIQDFLQKKQRC